MSKTQETSPQSQTRAPTAAAPQAADGLMDKVGRWAYRHHDFLNSGFARIAIRNVGSCVAGITALVPVFVLDKKGLNSFANSHTAGFDANGKPEYSGNALTRTLAATAGNSDFRQVTAVGLSFSSYRLINKACKGMYDTLAEQHGSEQEAVETAHKMKGIFTRYVGKFAKFEFLATVPAAAWLVLTQAPFGKGPEGFNGQNTKKAWLKASAIAGLVAYPGFFSITNGIFKKATGHSGTVEEVVAQAQKGDSPEFAGHERFVHESGLDTHPMSQRLSSAVPVPAPQKPAPTLVDKTLGFAKFTAAIATGITGYYYTKRGLNFKTGTMKLTTLHPDGSKTPGDSFAKSLYKEGIGFQSFFVFTALEEISNKLLNKPVEKLAGALNRKIYGDAYAVQQPVTVASSKPETFASTQAEPAETSETGKTNYTADIKQAGQDAARVAKENAGTIGAIVTGGARKLGEKGAASLQPSHS